MYSTPIARNEAKPSAIGDASTSSHPAVDALQVSEMSRNTACLPYSGSLCSQYAMSARCKLWSHTLSGGMPASLYSCTTFARALAAVVDVLGNYGISVVLDMHQDVASPLFCGNGFPDWAVRALLGNRSGGPLPFPQPVGADPYGSAPYPSREECLRLPFGAYYLSDAVSLTFERLYKNESGNLRDLELFWETTARRFAARPNVLGFELVNEPWPGDLWRSGAGRFDAARANRDVLMPLYDRLAAAVRRGVEASAVRPRNETGAPFLFFEPVVTSTFAGDFAVPGIEELSDIGFTRPPHYSINGSDVRYGHRSVFSIHSYCPLLSGSGGVLTSLRRMACALYYKTAFHRQIRNALRDLGGLVPAFLTEWGAFLATSSSDPGVWAWDRFTARTVLGYADEDYLSATYWQYKSFADPTTQATDKHGKPCEGMFDGNNSFLPEKAAMLARPYAPAVSGIGATMSFDEDSRTFVLKFVSTPPSSDRHGGPAPADTTVIFVSPLTYALDRLEVAADPPEMFDVTVDTRALPRRVLVRRVSPFGGAPWTGTATVTVREAGAG